MIRKAICKVSGHIWHHDTKHPVHGYYNRPIPGAYCKRCRKQTGKQAVGVTG